MFSLACHARMAELYRSLGDSANVQVEMRMRKQLVEDMELTCGVCEQTIGEQPAKLEVLPCFHIFHRK